jgi:DNA-binding response OmpR family regulator
MVVSDVELKGENGFELARTVRQRWPRVGVILSSGRASPTSGDMPTNAVFLPKPYPLSALVKQVNLMAQRAAEPIIIVGEGNTVSEAEVKSSPDNVVSLRGGR